MWTDEQDVVSQFVDKFNEFVPKFDENVQASFILEQLTLLTNSASNRRYSPSLIASATTWLLNSPSVYNQLRSDVLTLLVPNYVKRLTSAINVDFGLSKSTETNLKTRFNHLAYERDKYVSIIIDAIYAHASIEFVGASFLV